MKHYFDILTKRFPFTRTAWISLYSKRRSIGDSELASEQNQQAGWKASCPPHDLIISKLAVGRPKDFEFAVAVARLFPMTGIELNNLIDEFRDAHPQAEAALRANVEIWKSKTR